jgi:carbamoyl-phosphate synthase large subunit
VEALPILEELGARGYTFYATGATARLLAEHGLPAEPVGRISQGDETILGLIRSRRVDLVVNTITGGAEQRREGIELRDGFQIRRAAAEANLPCLTSLDTARALVEALREGSDYAVLPVGEYRRDAPGDR